MNSITRFLNGIRTKRNVTRLITRNFPECKNHMTIQISGINTEPEREAFIKAIRLTARRLNYNRAGDKIGYKIMLDLQSSANQAKN